MKYRHQTEFTGSWEGGDTHLEHQQYLHVTGRNQK